MKTVSRIAVFSVKSLVSGVCNSEGKLTVIGGMQGQSGQDAITAKTHCQAEEKECVDSRNNARGGIIGLFLCLSFLLLPVSSLYLCGPDVFSSAILLHLFFGLLLIICWYSRGNFEGNRHSDKAK